VGHKGCGPVDHRNKFIYLQNSEKTEKELNKNVYLDSGTHGQFDAETMGHRNSGTVI